MSLYLINYNNPSLNVREFLSLGGESGSNGKLLSLGSVFSYKAKSLVRLFCDLLGNLKRYY
jgi:hypothetical protein